MESLRRGRTLRSFPSRKLAMVTLILGGARSGKSLFAETEASRDGREVVYIATAEVKDVEMQERIRHHRERRPASWRTTEEPVHLAQALAAEADEKRCLIVDCLTLWLTNVILADAGECIDDAVIRAGKTFAEERGKLLSVLPSLPGAVLLVSNEVGQGIVPGNALSRFFVDESGRLNQAIAQLSDRVYWMVAGCSIMAKGT
jgi:adenosylcobinamide kinase / adenosylcobinamide-phosphate guanylyltransferase